VALALVLVASSNREQTAQEVEVLPLFHCIEF